MVLSFKAAEDAGIESAGKTAALEARGGIEPPIKVLQTFALPLGDRASYASILTDGDPGITLPARKGVAGTLDLRGIQFSGGLQVADAPLARQSPPFC